MTTTVSLTGSSDRHIVRSALFPPALAVRREFRPVGDCLELTAQHTCAWP